MEGAKVSNKRNRNRFSLFIYPKFQSVLLVTNLITIIFILAFVEFRVVAYFKHMRDLGAKAAFTADHPFFKFIELQEEAIINNLVMTTIFAFVFSTLIYLIVSHKMSGPILRLKSYFYQMAVDKKINKLSFRKRDFFGELPALINGALLSIGKDECITDKDELVLSSDSMTRTDIRRE